MQSLPASAHILAQNGLEVLATANANLLVLVRPADLHVDRTEADALKTNSLEVLQDLDARAGVPHDFAGDFLHQVESLCSRIRDTSGGVWLDDLDPAAGFDAADESVQDSGHVLIAEAGEDEALVD